MFEQIVMYLHKNFEWPMRYLWYLTCSIFTVLCWGRVILQIMPYFMPDYNLAGFNGWRSQVFLVNEQNRSRAEQDLILSKMGLGPRRCNKTFTKSERKWKFTESFMYQLMNYSCFAGYIHINYKNVQCLSRCPASPIVLWRIVFLLIKGMAEAETRRKRFP